MGILPRPFGRLRSLPLKYRWEVTRRHPYYLRCWKIADGVNELGQQLGSMLLSAQQPFLGAIGVSAATVPPETSFETLVSHPEGPTPSGMGASVQPLSMRSFAGFLLTYLTTETRQQLADLFLLSAEQGEGDSANLQLSALTKLASLDSPDLDKYMDQPIVAISPVLTANALTSDLREFLENWREKHHLKEERIRKDKFDQYFAVWDAREGWTGSGYEMGDVGRLVDVARKLKISESTARNHYRAAFELITGHVYCLEKWLRIFGLVKFSDELMSQINGALNRRVQRTNRGPTLVQSSALGSRLDRPDISSYLPADKNDALADWELMEDLRLMIKEHRSDAEIAEELELPLDFIPGLKARYEE